MRDYALHVKCVLAVKPHGLGIVSAPPEIEQASGHYSLWSRGEAATLSCPVNSTAVAYPNNELIVTTEINVPPFHITKGSNSPIRN